MKREANSGENNERRHWSGAAHRPVHPTELDVRGIFRQQQLELSEGAVVSLLNSFGEQLH
jgi:hypothetical protein